MIKLTFLGTSGAVPNKRRNHPSILMTYNGENILVDCGEGTQRQLRIAGISPAKITRLLITHWHSDHILGIPGMIQTMALSDYKKTFFIYGPKGTKRNMKEIFNAFPFTGNINLKVEEVDGKFFETDDFYLESKPMTHGIPCNAYCFVKKGQRRIDKKKLQKSKLPPGPLIKKLKEGKDIMHEGKKYLAKNLTYLQDSRKICLILDSSINKNMLSIAKDSDLLIVESTYEEELSELAKEHKHMTSKHAAEVAKKSKSKKLVLTHLSERYDKNPEKILNEAKKYFKETYLVNDLDIMEV